MLKNYKPNLLPRRGVLATLFSSPFLYRVEKYLYTQESSIKQNSSGTNLLLTEMMLASEE